MKPLFSPILAIHSVPRERIYQALLSAPDRTWRVTELAAQLPDVSVEAVRTTLYLMLGEHLVEPVAHRRSLTLRLNEKGRSTVQQIAAQWAMLRQSLRGEA